MEEDRIRKLADAAIVEKEKELEDLLRESPEWHFTIKILYESWHVVAARQIDVNEAKKMIMERIKEQGQQCDMK